MSDTHLQKNIAKLPNNSKRNAVISQFSIIEFVDFIIGMDTDSSSLSRLMWGSCEQSEEDNLITYFIHEALDDYHDVMGLVLPEIFNKFIPLVTAATKREGISLFPGGSLESKSRTAKFLDRFEDDFYADMSEAIKKLSLR